MPFVDATAGPWSRSYAGGFGPFATGVHDQAGDTDPHGAANDAGQVVGVSDQIAAGDSDEKHAVLWTLKRG